MIKVIENEEMGMDDLADPFKNLLLDIQDNEDHIKTLRIITAFEDDNKTYDNLLAKTLIIRVISDTQLKMYLITDEETTSHDIFYSVEIQHMIEYDNIPQQIRGVIDG